MKATEEYLMRGSLSSPIPEQQQKKEVLRREIKTCMVGIAGMQSGGKVCFKRKDSHPSEAHRKEHKLRQKLQQTRWRAAEGRINSKNKDIKANDQSFLQSFLRAPGGKAALGQGVCSSTGDPGQSWNVALPVCTQYRALGKYPAGQGVGTTHFWW